MLKKIVLGRRGIHDSDERFVCKSHPGANHDCRHFYAVALHIEQGLAAAAVTGLCNLQQTLGHLLNVRLHNCADINASDHELI